MRKFDWRFLVGLLLVLAGGFFMAQQWFGWEMSGSLVGIIFGLAGAAFLYVLVSAPDAWWAVIPGLTLLGLAQLIIGGEFAPRFTQVWGASIFLGSIGLAFLIIFLLNRSRWWAIIPAGSLFSVAATALVASINPADSGLQAGGVLFLGLGATFLSLLLINRPETKRWPYFPGGILLVMGVVILLGSADWLKWVWPAALLLGGVVVIFFTLRGKKGSND